MADIHAACIPCIVLYMQCAPAGTVLGCRQHQRRGRVESHARHRLRVPLALAQHLHRKRRQLALPPISLVVVTRCFVRGKDEGMDGIQRELQDDRFSSRLASRKGPRRMALGLVYTEETLAFGESRMVPVHVVHTRDDAAITITLSGGSLPIVVWGIPWKNGRER